MPRLPIVPLMLALGIGDATFAAISRGSDMSDRFKPFDAHHDQPFLMPPSVRDWLPQDHLAFFVGEALEQIDLSALRKAYTGKSPVGQPPYDPLLMTRLLMYAYCVGIFSSRKIERATHEDVGFRVVAANQHPDHDTIAEFRKNTVDVFQGIFRQVLQLCERAGMVKLGIIALDGSKIKANASKHKAMSYDWMQKREKELAEQVAQLIEQAQQADEQDDARYGRGRKAEDLPEELRFKEKRLEKIRQAKKELEEMAQQQAEARQRERKVLEDKAREQGRQLGGYPPKIDPTPDSKAQRNFTDPESRIMKGPDGFIQAFNGQAAVDQREQVIVACDVTDHAVDNEELEPMMGQVYRNVGRLPNMVDADAGFFSERNIELLERLGVDAYIATTRQKHGDQPPAPPRGRIPSGASAKERMRRKLMTQRGRQIYSRRKVIVEPVFGQIKNRGFRRFSMRGLKKVRGEWALACTTHNLLKLFRKGRRAAGLN